MTNKLRTFLYILLVNGEGPTELTKTSYFSVFTEPVSGKLSPTVKAYFHPLQV